MSNFAHIKEIPIIKRLQETEFINKFTNLVDYAAPILDGGPQLKALGFTPHDFSHHVKDIYILLDKMLPEAFYKKYGTGENLFVLLTGALFHDIGMTKEWSDDVRARHSEIGRDMFCKPFDDNNVSHVIKQNVDAKYSNYIGDIIYAHSDIKKSDGTIVETFREVYDRYEQKQYVTKAINEEINVPFLAALLRLADELDITYERIENINYTKMNNLPSSLQHFRLCELFKDIQCGKNQDKLVILLDENKCNLQLLNYKESNIDNKDEHNNVLKLATDAANILERYEKIQKEFKMLNELVLRNTSYASDDTWKIRRIELDNEEKLIAAVKKKRILLDDEGNLDKVIIHNNLFKSGHYRLDALHSVRDWIDLGGLFSYEDGGAIKYLISNDKIKDIIISKETIIGINHYGAILAALIGYKYGKPFAYIFDSEKTVDALEREINQIETTGIVLVTDVIVFGDSLCKVLDSMNERGIIDETNGVDVIVLFERIYKKSNNYRDRYNLSKIYSSRFVHKVYVISDSFDVELCKKSREECIFRKGINKEVCDNERSE